ncbi:MAG TPA: hypothetical protein VMH79_03050 [Thermoanaerobaculia bacterium]|nr:hypothetical protein [Thermoanaerobaculia bacterium]
MPRATPWLLLSRWVAAARRVPLEPEDDAWARALLTPAERVLWETLPLVDRRHSVEVARHLQRRLAATAYAEDALWLGAALMHDVGKVPAGLSAAGRAMAAVLSKVIRVATARRWARRAGGFRRRLGCYLVHGEVGAALIREAGGREPVAAWTEVHQAYRGAGTLSIPKVVVEALYQSDFR